MPNMTKDVLFEITNRTVYPFDDEYVDIVVEADNDSRRINFSVCKYFDGVDLSTKNITIRFNNALQQYDEYTVKDMKAEDDVITFSWLISNKVVIQCGEAMFDVLFWDEDGYRWHTKPAKLKVEHGLLESDAIASQEAFDVYDQWRIEAKKNLEATTDAKDAAKVSETNAKESETNAKQSEDNAKVSETNAATSETNAGQSEANALASENAAKTSETNAANSAAAAKTSETAATNSANAAKLSAKNAKASETNAKESETNAKASEDSASESKDSALDYANKAAATEIRVNAKATDVETNRQFVADAKQQVASDKAACEDAVTKCAGYVGYTKTGFIVKDDGKVQFIYYND